MATGSELSVASGILYVPNKMIHTDNSGDALDGRIILLVCEISSRCGQDGRADCSRAGMTPSLIRPNGCLLQKAAVNLSKNMGLHTHE
jgi:hypothetical protein